MFGETILSPSILSADFMNLKSEVEAIESAGADWVHFDVIDGVFAPNITFGIPLLCQLRSQTKLPIDVHLMVIDPLEKLPWFLECGPDIVTVHLEAFDQSRLDDQARRAAALIHGHGCRAGIALKPDTPIDVLDTTLDLWDMVLVMSVLPGFSGQSFIPDAPDRVEAVAQNCAMRGLNPFIQVDGGMDGTTAPLVAAKGADVIVAGNAVFASEDYAGALAGMRSAACSAASASTGTGI